MNFFRSLFGPKSPAEERAPVEVQIESAEYLTEVSNGANLVDGKPTWQHAESSRDDLAVMLNCCEAELKTMETAKVVAAPFYFERAAILLRRIKEYDREVEICERYVRAVDLYYSSVPNGNEADLRKGPRYQAIRARIPKAKALQQRAGDA